MKNILIFLLFFISTYLFSQVESGYVTYGESIVSAPVDTSKIKDNQIKMIISQQNSAIRKALSSDSDLYEMHFNKKESNFELVPFLENDINPNLKRAVSNGIYYNNLEKDISLHQLYAYDEYFLIKDESNPFDWKISKDSKKIGDYICYKATTIVENHRKIKSEIVVWFTPEIPFQYGPKNYGGLPGLILALQERGHYFYAKKIVLSNKEKVIGIPKKGKKVSLEEFNEFGKKIMMEMRGDNE